MADLDDLNFTSILDMSNDEAIDTLRQIRLSRRTEKKSSTRTTQKQTAAKISSSIKPDMAAELLKILEGGDE